MDRSKLAGVLWLVAAAFAVTITVVFRVDTVQWIVTIAAATAAAVAGVLLLIRPNAEIVTWSNVAGMAWMVIYALLAVQQRDELVAWTTDVFLGVLGVVAAILAYRTTLAVSHRKFVDR